MLLAALIVPWASWAQGTAISSFPWSCNFEDATENAAWTFSNASPNGWYIGTAVHNGGTHAMYVSNNNGTSNAYDGTTSCVSYAYVTLDIASSGQYALQFDWKCGGESTYDFLRVAVASATTALPTTYSDWTATAVPANFMAVDGGSKLNLQGTTWQTHTAVVSVTAAGTYRLIFVWRNDPSVTNSDPAAIDNVTITELTCPQPTALTVSGLTNTDATISWTAGGSESEWVMSLNGGDWESVTNPVTLDTLTSNTLYNVRLRAVCGMGDTSLISTTTFRTTCEPINGTMIPYTENFETYGSGTTAFPSCWTKLGSTADRPYIHGTVTYGHGDNSHGLYFYAASGGYCYAVMPPLATDVDITTLQVTFWARQYSASYNCDFVVGVMTNPLDANTFTAVDQVHPEGLTYEMFDVPLSGYTGTGNFIAFKAVPHGSSTAAIYLLLDDVTLGPLPTCPHPTGLTVESVTADSVTFRWTATGSESEWLIYLNDTLVDYAYDTTFTLTNLSPNTLYNIGVAAYCGIDDTSTMVSTSARTLCSYLDSLPYTENFDGVPGASSTSVAVNNLPPCWLSHNVGTNTSYSGYPIVYNSSSYAHSGSQAMRFYTYITAGTYSDQIAILPPTDPTLYPVNTLKVDFWMRANTTSYNSWCVVGVMTNPSDASSFVPVETIYTNSSTTYAHHEVMLGSYNGPHGCVAFKFPQPTTGYNYGYVDDITLDLMPTCPHVASVEVVHTAPDSIVVSWVPNGSETAWVVDNGVDEFVANDTTFAFDNLNSSTVYTISVRALCDLGDTSDAVSVTAHTECVYATLPIIENFDGMTGSTVTSSIPQGFLPPCWDIYNDGTRTTYQYSPYVYNSSTYAHSGSNCIRFYSYNSSGDSSQYLILPAVNPDDYEIADLQLSFWLRGYSASSNYFANVVVGVMTNPAVESSFIPYDTINYASTTYAYREVNFNHYTGPHGRVTMMFPKPLSSSQYEYGYVDDISLGPIPTCLSVENVTTAHATADSIILSWLPGDSESEWMVTYDSGSFTVTDTFFVADNLSPNTEYTFHIYAICGVGDTSYPVNYSTRTDCGPITVLPYIDGFESYDIGASANLDNGIPCWARLDNATSYHFGYVSSNSGTSYGPHTGSKHVYYYMPTTAGTYADWNITILPAIDTNVYPMNTLQLSFWVRMNSATVSSFIEVGVISDVTDATTFTPVDTIPVAGDVYTLKTAYMSSYTGYGDRIAMRLHRGTETHYFCIDDVTIEPIPACPPVSNIVLAGLDSNLLSVTWQENGAATSWEVEYGPHGFTLGNGTTATVTTLPYDITNLTPNTEYDVYVTPVCSGGTSATRMGTFRTANVYVQLPFSCGFEDSVQNSLWVLENGTNTNKWHIGTATNNGGTHALYISDNNGVANSYTITTAAMDYAYTDVMLSAPGDYGYSFDWKCEGESTWDFIRVALVPVSESFTAGTALPSGLSATAMPASWIALDGGSKLNLQSTWQTQSGVVSVASAGVYHLVFAWRNDGSGGTTPPAAIDNVELAQMTCNSPQNVTLSNLTQTSVDVSWSEMGSATTWQYQLGTATPVTVTDSSCMLTNLTANTEYTFRVRSICGQGDTSFWTVYTFRTPCGYANLPYIQDFENESTGSSTSTSFANCMTRLNNGTTYFGHPYISSTSSYNHTANGTKGLYWCGSITTGTYGDYQYVILPPVDVTSDPINTLQISFWAKASSTSYNPVFHVGVMTNPNDTAITVLDTIIINGNTTWTEYTVTLNNYTGTGEYVAIRALRPTSTWYAYVDDIMLDHIPTCPAVTQLVASNATTTSATIDWTDVTVAPQWEVEYTGNGATNVTTVTSHPATITGLSASSAYIIRVRPICGVGDTGYWSMPLTATTECGLVSLPYVENFDSYTGTTYSTAGVLPVCWDGYSNGTSAVYFPHITGSGSYWYPHSNPNVLTMTSGSTATYGNTKVVVLPTFDQPLTNLSMTYWYKMESATSGTLYVGYVTGSDFNATFVPIKTVTSTTTLTRDSVSFDTVPATATHIAFKWYQNSTFYSVGIDDIEVTSAGPVCNKPTNLTASNVTFNAATVTWMGPDSTEVGIHQGLWDETGATMATVTNHTYTFTGLTPNTQYTVAARTLCEDNMTSEWVYTTITTDDLPCFAPSNIQVSNETTNGGKVTWTPGGNETEWIVNVFRTGIIDTNFTVINTPMYNVSDLYAATTYTISVASVCGGIDTVWCDSTATLTTTACLPPDSVAAVANGHNAMVTWISSGANEYHVLWYLEGWTTGADSVVVTNGTTNATITGLEQGETYDIYVYAYCDGQRSAQAGRTQVTITGIDDVNSSLINLYPNPANTTVTVDGIQGEALVTIVDMNGRTVFSEKAVGKLTIDLNGMAQGAYFVRITGENTTAIRKLIVK